MNATLQALLDDRKPSKRGVHGTANAFTVSSYYEAQVGAWAACGFDWVKLVASDDSQVNFCRWLREHHCPIIPVIRPYENDAPNNHFTRDKAAKYVEQGVVIFESPMNEYYANYENIWNSTVMYPERLEQIAHGWAMFATEVLAAGGVPTTPAIESWHYGDNFMPLMTIICDKYADLAKQSICAGHWRPLNHPISYDEDPGGYRGWESFDDFVYKRLGEQHIPMICTEAGPEIGWHDDPRFPEITPFSHATMVRDILAYPTPEYYLADMFWLWRDEGTFTDASYIGNRKWGDGADLPVVNMLQTWRPEAATPDLTDDGLREMAEQHGQEIRIYADGAIYKRAQAMGLGYPVTNEWHEYRRIWQRYENPAERTKSVVSCRETTYDDLRAVTWAME